MAFMSTPAMLVHNGKYEPEAIRSGQISCFFYDILVPYNLPHMLVYSYRKEFLHTSHQAVRPLIMTLSYKCIIYGKGDK